MSTIQPKETFQDLLFARDKDLYGKWFTFHELGKTGITFTAIEKDIIQCVAIQARAVTNFQGE